MRRPISLLAVSAILAGCSARNTRDADSATPQAAASAKAAPAAAPSQAAQGRAVHVENDLIDFDYAYPAAAAAIPKLKAWLDADIAKQEKDIRQGALDDREQEKKNDFPVHQFSYTTKWQVVAEIPGWLSLSADRWEFTGGAHGNPWFDTLLWDKTADTKREPLDLFATPAALSGAIRAPFCDRLDKQRGKKRGQPVDRNGGDEFDQCIDPVESTVILGSSDKQHFDRIGVLVGPYAAGPYVEGTYEVTLPVTQKVMAVVKPRYRQYFALGH